MFAGGLTLIGLVTVEVFLTTVSTSSPGGPVSHRLVLLIWRVLRRLARSPRSRLLAAAGPTAVVVLLLSWIVGLWVGWSLLFAADPAAVVDADSGRAVGGWDRVYYAGFALFTLGVGDVVAVGAWWRTLTVVATINGFVLLTMSVSYLIPVIMAVTERRTLAILAHRLGTDVDDALRRAWDGVAFTGLDDQLVDLARRIARLSQQYLSYPLLHLFHTTDRDAALEPSLAVIAETALVLRDGVERQARPPDPVLDAIVGAIDRFVDIASRDFVRPLPDAPPPPDLGTLRETGIPLVEPARFHRQIADRAQRRRALAGLVTDARWSWPTNTPPDGGEPEAQHREEH
jgi:hypothetical protein